MLITLEQIQAFKSITSNINTTKSLDPYIQEAEEFDLRPFLGDELYIDLVSDYETSPQLSTYSDLYNGCTYTHGTRTYKHEGIVPVLAYFAYARYVQNSNHHSTKYGVVVKTNEFSQQPSEKLMTRLIQQARSGAVMYQERVKLFLDHNADDYELWRGGIARRKGSMKLSPIGGNSSRKNRFCIKCDNIVYYNNCECGCTDYYYQ